MIIRANKCNKIKTRESLILPRLIKVLEDVNVTVQLVNGTKVTGTVESYGKKIITVSLKTALAELSLSNEIYKDLDEYVSEDEQLKQVRDYCNSAPGNGCNINGSFGRNDSNYRIVGDSKSFVLLKEAKVECNCKVFEVWRVSIPEAHIATLTVNATNTAAHSLKNKSSICRNGVRRIDVKKMIVNWHKNEMKNEAFVRCNRIGTNNTKT
ncbi:hypothetical protein TOT_040000601 [Theileria orientalis strain Shintoku]|uniref:Uncharacterized protein n=1 Tax=Theileria orientalis strain Shintoku TaxID=869250 RepID=J4C4I2_THEOR|nr:hypothetical protein TOT_040000601 [Theileria orientalis strain Shintoku]BAM42231.1 hypothetical protein TOT_040000601 [Theileria orientalis strain Shintoku]|eukprot:XP_009692532.1 hypothetical protein TOT_040000601 [Theileria orientalis strain Shintoku]